MGNIIDSFSAANFKSTIKRFCNEQGWNPTDITNTMPVLQFEMESGQTQTLSIIKYETTLEFSVQSSLYVDDEDDLPHEFSSALLQRNAGRKIGYWAIENIENKFVYSCMHNAEMSLIDSTYFAEIIAFIVQECEDVEMFINSMDDDDESVSN